MSTPESILVGSPHQLEEQLEHQELSQQREKQILRIARSVGSQALGLASELSDNARANLGSYYGWAVEMGGSSANAISKNILDYYNSVPESIHNLDLVGGVETSQASAASSYDKGQQKSDQAEADTHDIEDSSEQSDGLGGGEEPPEEPSRTAETTSDSSEEPEGGESFGLPPELVQQAQANSIPLETVRMAIDDGYENPIEALISIRAHEPLRQDMERMGFNLPSLEDKEHPAEAKRREQNKDFLSDPYVAQLQKGIDARSRIDQLDDEIRNHPFRLRRRLKRPGLPILRHVPWLGPKAARYVLSWQIYQKELENRRENKKIEKKKYRDMLGEIKTLESKRGRSAEQEAELAKLRDGLREQKIKATKKYHDGFLGRSKRKFYSDKIKSHDAKIIDLKGKLGPLEYREYTSDEIPSTRRALAERIYQAERESQALKNKLINPADSYISRSFRDEVKKQRGEPYPGATDLERKVRQL